MYNSHIIMRLGTINIYYDARCLYTNIAARRRRSPRLPRIIAPSTAAAAVAKVRPTAATRRLVRLPNTTCDSAMPSPLRSSGAAAGEWFCGAGENGSTAINYYESRQSTRQTRVRENARARTRTGTTHHPLYRAA